MSHHVFRGGVASATCNDCALVRQWDDVRNCYVYRRPPSKAWATEKPDCTREVSRDVESGVRA